MIEPLALPDPPTPVARDTAPPVERREGPLRSSMVAPAPLRDVPGRMIMIKERGSLGQCYKERSIICVRINHYQCREKCCLRLRWRYPSVAQSLQNSNHHHHWSSLSHHSLHTQPFLWSVKEYQNYHWYSFLPKLRHCHHHLHFVYQPVVIVTNERRVYNKQGNQRRYKTANSNKGVTNIPE